MTEETVVEELEIEDDGTDFEASFEILEKIDDADQGFTFVRGPVLVPDVVDKQGDVISAEEIQKAAHAYAEDSQRAGLMHQVMLGKRETTLVETYIARTAETIGGTRVKKGSWIVGFRVYAPKLRKMITDGTLRGFSMGGAGSVDTDENDE